MPREIRGFGGCTGEHKRSARQHNQIFPHGILLSDIQESNAPAASPAVTGIAVGSIRKNALGLAKEAESALIEDAHVSYPHG
jgi:hypothetical protein